MSQSTDLAIRRYRAADRADLQRIAADTAFFGEPVEHEMEDRRLFLDFFYAYYTDIEPEHIWVACAEQRVVGFLTGCFNTARKERIWQRQILPRVLWRLFTGRYHLGRRTRRFMRALIAAGWRHENPTVDTHIYPAHLHINLDASLRGQGLGRRLMQAYLDDLRANGVPGVHLGTTSYNIAACQLYERMGFQLLAARPTRIWAHIIDRPIELRAYGRLV